VAGLGSGAERTAPEAVCVVGVDLEHGRGARS
jgi:hypothetical protein